MAGVLVTRVDAPFLRQLLAVLALDLLACLLLGRAVRNRQRLRAS